MLKRIIACLDIDGRKVVKGTRYLDHKNFGDPVVLAQKYADEGADEIVIYDIKASVERRLVYAEVIARIASLCRVPICVAGGIRTVEDARKVLSSGADKVSINSAALENPDLIRQLANEFGRQCVVIGIDLDSNQNLLTRAGNLKQSVPSNLTLDEWLSLSQELGAGEIVINSIERDGTKSGFDTKLYKVVRTKCRVPLIASSGAGTVDHFREVFAESDVDGALAAGILHRGEVQISDIKNCLLEAKIPVRII